MELKVHIERKGSNRISVDWSTPDRVEWGAALSKLKTVAGRSFAKAAKTWSVPLDFQVCQQLRTLYGPALVIGPELKSWAVNEKRKLESLGSIALATYGELVNLPTLNPVLYEALYIGPLAKDMTPAERKAAFASQEHGSYQTADVRFLVDSDAPLNGNHPGTGKTPETIGALYEGGWYTGIGLVIAPKVAVDSVWEDEFLRWAKDDVKPFACVGARAQRQAVIDNFKAHDGPKVLIVNPQMIQYVKDDTHTSPIVIKCRPKEESKTLTANAKAKAAGEDFDPADPPAGFACLCDKLKDGHWHYIPSYPELFEQRWDYIVNDEVHKGSIRNHRSLTSRSIHDLKAQPGCKRMALSGTPMKKKGADLWGILHWLRPDVFTAYWNFAERFFEIDENAFGKKVLGLREDKKEDFYSYLTPYMLRRTKAECAPWLPDKFYIDVDCPMTEKQLKQYKEMEANGAVNIGSDEVATTGILAEFTRLRQFANAYCTVKDGKVIPTMDSGKIEKLWELLEERGIFDNERNEKVIIFSQFEELVTLVHVGLRAEGVEALRITGKENKAGQRKAIMQAFQDPNGPRVIVMTTTAGGVAITLDAADTVVFMDETWSPDEMEQAEDRAHRTSKVHQVTVYVLRSKASIDAYVHETCADKAYSQSEILDVRRKVLAAAAASKAKGRKVAA
jgi:SNF2 family DNA or RNA helicase